MKERGLSVSFNSFQNPAPAGFFAFCFLLFVPAIVGRVSEAPPGNPTNDINSHFCDAKHISLFS
jgi:hypothetical protein